MIISLRLACLALLCVLASGCAGTGTSLRTPDERMSARLALYEQHAGVPVDRFRFWDMKRFEVLGEHTLAVWTTIDDAWLIRVMPPCTGLVFANAIALSSTDRHVYQRFDTVNFDQQRCRIASIRPVDGAALGRAEEAAP